MSTTVPSLAAPFAEDRKRFQDIVHSQVPALVLDEEGTIRHVTSAARRMLDYRNEDVLSGSFFSQVHGRNLYQVMRDVADMVCYGKARASWLIRLRTARGLWRWIKADALNQLDGPTPSITVLLRDLHD